MMTLLPSVTRIKKVLWHKTSKSIIGAKESFQVNNVKVKENKTEVMTINTKQKLEKPEKGVKF